MTEIMFPTRATLQRGRQMSNYNRRNAKLVPEDRGLVELVRSAMASNSRNVLEAAVSVNMSERTYSLVRKLLVLKDRGTLGPEDTAVVDQAIRVLEDSRGAAFKAAVTMTKDVMSRHWFGKTRNGIPTEKRLARNGSPARDRYKAVKRFENTMFAIREACSNNDEMGVPSLTKTARREFSNMLIDSIDSLWRMWHMLKAEAEGDGE